MQCSVKSFDSLLFAMTDLTCLDTIYQTVNKSSNMSDESYYQLNVNRASRQPSACIGSYIKFLNNKGEKMENLLTEKEITERVKAFQTFQSKWDMQKLKDMTLEEYTKLESKETLTYVMERVLKFVPMGGGNAFKFGIYQCRNAPKIKYCAVNNQYYETKTDGNYAWISYYGETAQEAFEKIKQIIISIADYSQMGQIEKIQEIQDFPHNFKWKIAFYSQNPNNLCLFGVVASYALKSIAENQLGNSNLKTSEIYKEIFQKYGKPSSLEKLVLFTRKMWLIYCNDEEYKTTSHDNDENSYLAQDSFLDDLESNNQPLNQILYGSPGTGKTYSTIEKALEICISTQDFRDSMDQLENGLAHEIENILKILKNDEIEDKRSARQKAKQIFDKLKNEKLIEFVTFHQNYGYEEFVEGIKPKLNDNKSNDIEYEIKDGIFKTLCNRAMQPEFENQDMLQKLEKAYKDYTARLYKHPFSLLSTNYIDERPTLTNIKELIANEEPIKQAKTLTDKASFYVMTDTSDSIRVLANTEKPSPMPLTYNEFIGSYCLDKKGTRFSYYGIFDEILKEANLNKDEVRQALSKQVANTKPYILIIDEINRGNVSKIFGELITLIEPSKRIGANEELRVTLPYSGSQESEDKELFGVPSNLYIIGTMNTADRSITSLDTALRRRFEFVEMMPDPAKLSGKTIEGIELQEMLKAINERIEFLYDREKTIGHAYLLEIDLLSELKEVFQNKIIPLLQEYFYNDYEAIQAILNDNGMIEEEKKENINYLELKGFKNYIDERGIEKKIFKIAPKNKKEVWNEADTYKKIYGEGKNSDNNQNTPEVSDEQ